MTRDEWRVIFGNNLSDVLEEVGISQNQLAKECRLSTGSISDYVNGWSTPNIPTLINMAYTLDVSVDELVDVGECIDD